MIESFLENLVKELGATGVLVIGLYYILSNPLKAMAQHLKTINEELQSIISLLTNKQGKN